MERELSLIIMAAGLGSRFGQGIKQLTSFGPCGEIIMDYSIHDALEAGFNHIVFVLRRDLEKDFKEIIGERIEKHVRVSYAFQEKEDLPQPFALPPGRTKPWGTGQAVLVCRSLIHGPFAVINADDYYGKEAFVRMHDFLLDAREIPGDHKMPVGMAGFVMKHTLSEHGGVTRGICSISSGHLTGITETKNIFLKNGKAVAAGTDGAETVLDPDAVVSMNFWGFLPEMMEVLEKRFERFLGSLEENTKLTKEFLLPEIVDDLLQEGAAGVTVCPSRDRWFGVTYQEDIPLVREAFAKLAEQGAYPSPLWK